MIAVFRRIEFACLDLFKITRRFESKILKCLHCIVQVADVFIAAQFTQDKVCIVIRQDIEHADIFQPCCIRIAPHIRIIIRHESPFTEIGDSHDVPHIRCLVAVIGHPHFKTCDLEKAVDLW